MADGSTVDRAGGGDKETKKGVWKNLIVLAITTVVVLAGVWGVQALRGGGAPEGVPDQSVSTAPTDGDSGGSDGGDAADPDTSGSDATPVDVENSEVGSLVVGEPAPSFEATTLDGRSVSLADLRGQPAWLLFNATWCADCRAEIPDVADAFHEFEGDINILSIYVSDSVGAVEQYSSNLQIPYPQVVDDSNRIAAQYGVVGLPTSVFLTSDGVVEEVHVGALSPSAINEKLLELVDEAS